jgi:hypothetical protein
MDIFKDEITPELDRIQKKISAQNEITEDDLKIILLGLLNEEDQHENNIK